MNWVFLVIFGIIVLVLLIFLVMRNQKDERKFEKDINTDYIEPEDIVNRESKNPEIPK